MPSNSSSRLDSVHGIPGGLNGPPPNAGPAALAPGPAPAPVDERLPDPPAESAAPVAVENGRGGPNGRGPLPPPPPPSGGPGGPGRGVVEGVVEEESLEVPVEEDDEEDGTGVLPPPPLSFEESGDEEPVELPPSY